MKEEQTFQQLTQSITSPVKTDLMATPDTHGQLTTQLILRKINVTL